MPKVRNPLFRHLRRSVICNEALLTTALASLSLAMFGVKPMHAQQVLANGTTQTASGTIDTGMQGQPNGYALHAFNNGIITSSGSLTLITGGYGAFGAYARSGGLIDIAGGSAVTTSGAFGYGLFAAGTGAGGTISTIIATDTAIASTADATHAVVADYGAVINLTGGSIRTAGRDAYGAIADKGGQITIIGGSIATTGSSALGLWATETGSVITATDTVVSTLADCAHGVVAEDGGAVNLIGGSVTTRGEMSVGTWATQAGTVNLTGGSITTTGVDGYGLYADTDGTLNASRTNVQTWGGRATGALVIDGQLKLNNVSITTRGDSAEGVVADVSGHLTVTGGSVTTLGAFAAGLRSTEGSLLRVDGATITTSGANSYGAIVRGGSSLIIRNGTSIVTTGAGSAALYSFDDANPGTAAITDSRLISEQAAGIRTTGTTLNASFTGSSVTGGAALLQTINGGVLNLSTDSSTLTGAALTETSSGSISNVTLQNNTLWTITGSSNVSNLINNASTIRFAAPTGDPMQPSSYKMLTTGNYSGNGGTVIFNDALGGDASPTDRLHVMGDTSGATSVRVANRGGMGAPTVEGIRIIEVGGASDGQFSLLGDYVTKDSKQAVVGGAYAYTLEKNGVSTPSDGNWYLRSQIIPTKPVDPTDPTDPVDPGLPEGPRYAPGVPLYEAYPQVLQALNRLPTLQQRVGNRYWTNTARVAGANPADDGTGFWGRVEGVHTRLTPAFSTSSSSYDVDTFKLQAGLDGQLYEGDAGRLISGLTLHYGNASANVRSLFGDGRINTDGYGLGGTLTWYGGGGFYVDGQTQTTWFDSALNSQPAGRRLVSGNHGFGYALSVETGQRIALTPNWTLTPQAQLIYSAVSFDSFTDPFDARVSLDHADSLRGRLSLALDYEKAWREQDSTKSKSHLYGIANLHNEFGNGTRVDVAGTGFASRNDRLWGGLGLGGSFNWKDDRFSLYGEATANTSLGDFGDSYALSGTAGLRIKF